MRPRLDRRRRAPAGCAVRDAAGDSGAPGERGAPVAYTLPGGGGGGDPRDLPTQGRSVVSPQRGTALADRPDSSGSDLAYLAARARGAARAPHPRALTRRPAPFPAAQELMAIQQSGPRNIGFFGTRNMGFLHQQLIEILSYAMVLTVRAR